MTVLTYYSWSLTFIFISSVSVFGELYPQPKIWWTKQITDDLYTAGKLTESQVKYAAEAGFKSIISMFNFTTNSSIGEENIPDRPTMKYITEELCGIFYDSVLEMGLSWQVPGSIERFAEIMAVAPRPVLLHCYIARSATYNAVGYLALMSKKDPQFEPQTDSKEFYRKTTSLGYNFHGQQERETIAFITGEEIEEHPPSADVTISDWDSKYWLVKPVYKNWYILGQHRSNYAELLANLGAKVLINTRLGMQTASTPSQEEVTLLNIRDNTGSYAEGGRQSEQRLLATRLNVSRPAEYGGWQSTVNYHSRNALEFGDDIGYNEQNMQQTLKSTNPAYQYIHTPFGVNEINMKTWEKYAAEWKNITTDVVVTSRDGTRAVVVALLATGSQSGLNGDWAVARALELGYNFRRTHPEVVKLFHDVLSPPGATTLTSSSLSSMLCAYPHIIIFTIFGLIL